MDAIRDSTVFKSISRTYVQQGLQSLQQREDLIKLLLDQQRLPDKGWDDSLIEYLVQQLSIMDSNNFHAKAGVGEREGRVFSGLVVRRHFSLAHGIGRSGDIAEVQPKAAGSSALYKLTNRMASQALQIAGIRDRLHCVVLPLATGMTLALCLLALKTQWPGRRRVLWSRIDQKSCLKAMLLVGLEPIVVEQVMVNGQLTTDVPSLRRVIEAEKDQLLCVVTTTSCFAPRQPDLVDAIAELCARNDVAHVINNAYGLQCKGATRLINRALVKGRVDGIVQSTDKNFLVPVGGAILASPSEQFVAAVSASYPGRASMSPILDLFITLLAMGRTGYESMLADRQQLLPQFQERLRSFAAERQLRILDSPLNTISFAVACSTASIDGEELDWNFFGSMLFQRNVSGCRVVRCRGQRSRVAGIDFVNWGAHNDSFPCSYFTVACALGITRSEIEIFFAKLEKTFDKFVQRKSNASHQSKDNAQTNPT